MTTLNLLLGTAFVALLLASAVLWAGVALRKAAGGSVLPFQPRRPPPWGLVDLLLTAILLLSSQAVAQGLVRHCCGIAGSTPFEQLASSPRAALLLAGSLASLTACLASAAWLVVRWNADRHDLGAGAGAILEDIRLGTAAFIMLAPLVYGLQWLLVQALESKHPLLELLRQDPDPQFFAVSLVAAVLIAPVVEEYLFRVLLQGWLERIPSPAEQLQMILWGGRSGEHAVVNQPLETPGNLPLTGLPPISSAATDITREPCNAAPNVAEPQDCASSSPGQRPSEPKCSASPAPYWPVLVSALLFALAHWSHGPDPIPLFVLAVGLGTLYQRTHRILPCVLVHLLLNSVSLAVLWMNVCFRPA